MRTRTSEWFECKVRYDKTMDDGMQKKVTEAYTVDALSFTEAEKRITEEMSAYISGEFDIADIKRAAYKEIFFSDDDTADCWYKVKLQFITLDEKNGRETKSAVYYLVQAANVDKAKALVDEAMKGTMVDYRLESIAETKIMDVFKHISKEQE